MKINIGSKLRYDNVPIMALAIPGAGILEVVDRTEEYPFDHFELTRAQLKHLRDEIDKELENERV